MVTGKIMPWVITIINFVTALVCSFIISKVLMKSKKTRILIGEKK